MNKRICIVVYNYSDYGGVNAVATAKAKELSLDYDVYILSIIGGQKKIPYIINNNIQYDFLFDKEKPIRKTVISCLSPAIKYFTENKIDVAILMGHYVGFILCFLRFFIKTKLIFSDHGALRSQWNERKVRVMRFMAAFLCHRTVTLTEKSCIDYCRMFYIPKKKITYIYNWINFEEDSTSVYNVNSKKLISVGRFGKEKGFDNLIKIFNKVIIKHPDWTLDIYGDGEMMPTIKKLIEEFNLQNSVSLMGMQSDVVSRYKEYAIYLLPSYREGFPLVLLEAKACKLPIVSFDILTGPREIINDGIDGFLIPPYDLDLFSEAVCTLIENKKMRIEMSNHSHDNIYKFSKEKIILQWKNIIDNVSK